MSADIIAFVTRAGASLWSAASELLWLALGFAALALIARGAEAWRTARNAQAEVRTNLILFVFDVVVIMPLLAFLVGFTGVMLQQSGLTLSAATWSALPVWAVGFLAIFAGDFIGYWRHRLEHTAWLWPGHAIHHSDTAMTWTTGLRFHPLNRVTTALIDTSALALLGFPVWALVANNLVRHYYGLFIHMDLPWTYGPLGRVLVSPAMHRWHHVRDANGAGVDFATVFSAFDQAFGTYHVPGLCTVPLGVRDEIGKGALAQLLWPLRVVWRTSVNLIRYPGRAAGAIRDPGANA